MDLQRMKCIRDRVCDGEYEVVATVVVELWQDRVDMEFDLLNPRAELSTTRPAELTRCNKCGHPLPGVFNAQTKRGIQGMGASGKWTAFVEEQDNEGADLRVIHAVGDTAEEARVNVSHTAWREYGLVIEDHLPPEIGGDDPDYATLLMLFPGHLTAVND